MAGLYVHVPFRTAPSPRAEPDAVAPTVRAMDRYVRSASVEMRERARQCGASGAMETLHIGGGQPSLFGAERLRRLIGGARQAFPAAFGAVTVEVHPLDVTPAFLSALRAAGVTRVSLEALALDAESLRALGAPHTAADAQRALALVRDAGFASHSADLLFGAPGQSMDGWHATLRRAVDRGVPHLSVEEWTGDVPDDTDADERAADAFTHAMETLSAADYAPYDLTHFARPGHRSRHQEHVLAHGGYLGIGPSAHSFWWPSPRDATPARRWTNLAPLCRYGSRLQRGVWPVESCAVPSRRTLGAEFAYLRLRTDRGLDLQRLRSTYGFDLEAEQGPVLRQWERAGLVGRDGTDVRLTHRGRLQADAIAARLFVD